MKKKILLVDDEKDLILVMGKRIREWGYDLIEAPNGRRAVDAVKREKPDIIVLDYIMPEMNGVTALEEIRKIDKVVPVIMFTAFPDEKSIEGTENLGVSAYVPKMSLFASTESSLRAAISMAEKEIAAAAGRRKK